jgi:DNA-directed RNA polymerase subunit K/omega
MKDPLLEDFYKHIDSRYRLAHIISQRSKALQEGCEPLSDITGLKPTSLALAEFLEDKLEWKEEEGDEIDYSRIGPREFIEAVPIGERLVGAQGDDEKLDEDGDSEDLDDTGEAEVDTEDDEDIDDEGDDDLDVEADDDLSDDDTDDAEDLLDDSTPDLMDDIDPSGRLGGDRDADDVY